jgi:hypothetical protein
MLDVLPEWFGIPAALAGYVSNAEHLPTLAARANGPEPVGFLSARKRTSVASEAYVLGMRREWHHRGAGRLLVAADERKLLADGIRYVTVRRCRQHIRTNRPNGRSNGPRGPRRGHWAAIHRWTTTRADNHTGRQPHGQLTDATQGFVVV